MEEDIRKQGMIYLQQQRFGKKWKRVWCVLFRDSSCSVSRLEFYEFKEAGSSEKSQRKQQDHKKVIRMADCIRVSEVEVDGCPRDTAPFLIETTDKIYVFAADRLQLEDWTLKLCETAFPMNWTESGVKRTRLDQDQDQRMEDNTLYSSREIVQDFRVCVRRTEASDRCRLKGDGFLRADEDALVLLDKTRNLVYAWPYRFLRRFGRDKTTFSFEAGRRCDSGEGNFEFDTKQGNSLFQVVEAAINLQRLSAPPHRQSSRGDPGGPEAPHRQSSRGGPGGHEAPHRQSSRGDLGGPEAPQDLPLSPPLTQTRTPPLPQQRSHLPQTPAAQQTDCLYSLVTDTSNLHKDKETSSHHQLTSLDLPVDQMKSLTLETRGVRKNQLKMISSCPLPHAAPHSADPALPGHHPDRLSSKSSSNPDQDQDQTYSQIHLPAAASRASRKGGGVGGVAPACSPPSVPPEPEYSLPFDSINVKFLLDPAPRLTLRAPPGADPLYDSIDEMAIRTALLAATDTKVEHIYDEPEGCASTAKKPLPSLYDDPEEMKGDAWRIMGTDPQGHEYPYNPHMDNYAVPKRVKRVLATPPSAEEEEEGEGAEPQDSPYTNVAVKMA